MDFFMASAVTAWAVSITRGESPFHASFQKFETVYAHDIKHNDIVLVLCQILQGRIMIACRMDLTHAEYIAQGVQKRPAHHRLTVRVYHSATCLFQIQNISALEPNNAPI